jgi:hypothetical protein
MLKGKSGPKADKVRGMKKFHNEEFLICIPSPNIVRVIKSMTKRWREPAAYTGNVRNSGDILVKKI